MPVPVPALADVVVLELPSEHRPASEEAIASCNLVLGNDQCRAADSPGPAPSWYATVHWDAIDPLRAEVEVHREHAEGPLVGSRHVEFSAADSLQQRYRALGLLIVSHVVADASDRRGAGDDAEPPASAEDTHPMWGVDVSAWIGPGLGDASPRFGGFVRPWVDPLSGPIHPFLRLDWSVNAAGPDAAWYGAAAGASVNLASSRPPSVLLVHIAAAVEQVHLSATDPARGTESQSLLRYGGRLGLESGWYVNDHVALLLGVEGTLFFPAFSLEVDGRRIGDQGIPNWGANAGIRLSP